MTEKIEFVDHRFFIENPALFIRQGDKIVPNPILEKAVFYNLALDELSGASFGEESKVVTQANSKYKREMTNTPGAPIEINSLCGDFTTSSGTDRDFKIEIKGQGMGRSYMNRPIHARTILGTGSNPFKLHAPMVLPDNQKMNIEINTLSFVGDLSLFFPATRYEFPVQKELYSRFGKNYKTIRPFFYTTDEDVVLGSQEQKNFFFTTLEDSHFFLHRMTAYSNEKFDIMITNTANNRDTSNVRIPSSMFGTSEDYIDLKVPIPFGKKNIVRLNIRNLSTNENKIFITFTGLNYYDEI